MVFLKRQIWYPDTFREQHLHDDNPALQLHVKKVPSP